MFNLKKAFISALALTGLSGALSAHSLLETGRFYCDFATEEDYNLWTVVDVNGPTSSEYNFWFYSPTFERAMMKNGSAADGDDWLITPAITLEEGKTYSVKLKFAADYPCTFDLTYGTEATPESQISVTGATRYDGEQYEVYTLPAEASGGDFHIGIHCVTSKSDDGWLYIYSIDVAEANDGTADFCLINETTGEPIPGIGMKLESQTMRARSVSTSDEGHAVFDHLTPGEYTLTYGIDGFYPVEPLTVTVEPDQELTQTVYARPLVLHSVTGRVIDYLDRPLEGVEVHADGTFSYSAVTGEDGVFTLTDVRCPGDYRLMISRMLSKTYSAEITLEDEDLDLGDIRLDNFFGAPVNVTFDTTEAGMFISWLAPVGHKEFKHDNGDYQGMHSIQGNYIEYVHFGVKFDEPMIVEDISWVVCELNDGLVDLAIYPLLPDGAISTVAAWKAEGVESDTYRWTPEMTWQRYHLDTPVEMPYGCLVAVGHTAGGMNMAMDYRNNWGPSYTGHNDLSEGWTYPGISNFFIRAEGTLLSRDITLGQPQEQVRTTRHAAPAKAPMLMEGVTYKAWRIDESINTPLSGWKELPAPQRGLYTIDTDLESLGQGCYYYAVQAINHDGTESEITYSKEYRHRMTTDLTVYVFTNTAIDFADGAVVTLTDQESGQITEGIVSDNKVVFAALPKSVYSMRVERAGFNKASYGNLNYNSASDYTAYIDLELIPAAPFELAATQADDSQDVLLEWNKPTGIFDDFEQMNDFEINPAGEFGWTYADLDGGSTYGVAQCQQTPYPNMHSPMAFQAFNPYATTPDISAYVQPYSGQKVLVSVSLENGGRNNDYLFSRELSFDAPFTVRFQAAAGFFGSLGRERFMVGYTTGAPEPDAVIWLTEDPETVGGLWREFTYTMPAEARHAVIRCVSDQTMFFMIDDLFIGQEEADIFAMTSFRVYLDDEQVATTTARACMLPEVEEGKHLAKVQTVYQMADMNSVFSDFTELLFTVQKSSSSISAVSAEDLYSYSAATRTLTAGASAKAMSVYDIQGRIVGTGNEITFSPADRGVYLISITAADGSVIVRKFVI